MASKDVHWKDDSARLSLHPAKDFTHGEMFVSVVSSAETIAPVKMAKRGQSSLAQGKLKETINVATASAEVMGKDQTNHRT